MIRNTQNLPLLATSRVENAVAAWIRNGELPAGSRLPTEQTICRQVGVSRTTVRSALRLLHERGLIDNNGGGRGWFVSGTARPAEIKEAVPAPREALRRTVGVISGFNTAEASVGDNFKGRRVFVLLGLLQALAERGWTGAVQAPGQLRELSAGDYAVCRQWIATTDVVAQPEVKELLTRMRGLGCSVAVQHDSDRSIGFDQVVSDHAAGARMLAEWLLGRGCKRILHALSAPVPGALGDTGENWRRMRAQGFAEAHARAGLPLPEMPPMYLGANLPVSPEQFRFNTDIAIGWLHRAFRMDEGWDAVMCLSDGYVAPVKEALRSLLGPAAADKIMVAGYDNYWEGAPETRWSGHKPCATIDKRNVLLGRTLLEVLVERLENPEAPDPIVRRVEPELVVVNR